MTAFVFLLGMSYYRVTLVLSILSRSLWKDTGDVVYGRLVAEPRGDLRIVMKVRYVVLHRIYGEDLFRRAVVAAERTSSYRGYWACGWSFRVLMLVWNLWYGVGPGKCYTRYKVVPFRHFQISAL